MDLAERLEKFGKRYAGTPYSNPKMAQLLKIVFLLGPCSAYRLEKESAMSHAGVAGLVRKLVAQGWIEAVEESTFRTGLKTKKYFISSDRFDSFLYVALKERSTITMSEGEVAERLDGLRVLAPEYHESLKWWALFRDGGPRTRKLFIHALANGWADDFPACMVAVLSPSIEARAHSDAAIPAVFERDMVQRQKLQQELGKLLRENPTLLDILIHHLDGFRQSYQKDIDEIDQIEAKARELARGA